MGRPLHLRRPLPGAGPAQRARPQGAHERADWLDVAAATTSLPEEIGGERNWDYRFSWLRDSALTLNALFALGYDEEAHDYMAWLRRTTAGRARELQIMYGVGGERLLPEVELDWRRRAHSCSRAATAASSTPRT